MRLSGLLAIFAVSTILFAVGCGGGDGANSAPAVVNGVWTGTATQTRAIGDKNTLQIEFFQNGSALTGTAVVIGTGGSSVGALAGTIRGSQMTASIDNGSGSTATFTGVVSGTGITGTYSTASPGGATGGTFTLTKSAGVTTPNLVSIAPGWSGTYTVGGVTHTLSFQFTQTKDALTFTGKVGPFGTSGGLTSIAGTGAIVGDNVTLIFPIGTITTYLTGAYAANLASGTTISGAALESTGGTGTFNIAPDVVHVVTQVKR